MFCVFGKSLKRERSGVNKKYVPDYYFSRDGGAYQISPDFDNFSTCIEFIRIADSNETIRCLSVARASIVIDKKGNPVLDKKTGKTKKTYRQIPIGELLKLVTGGDHG